MDKRRINEMMADPEFERQYRLATKHGKEKLRRLPKASSARFDTKSRLIVLEMKNGVTVLVPVELVHGLQTNDSKALADFELVLDGSQIHWNELDVQFYVEDFLRVVFGTPKWMSGLKEHLSTIGRKGGQAKTAAKKKASAENGKKGGRPRKPKSA